MINRSRWDIIVDILEAVKGGESNPNGILTHSNLNQKMLKFYLSLLTNGGLIAVEESGRSGRCYTITEKGERVIKLFRELKQLIPLNCVEAAAPPKPKKMIPLTKYPSG